MLTILLIDGEIQNVRDAAVGEQACKAAEVFVFVVEADKIVAVVPHETANGRALVCGERADVEVFGAVKIFRVLRDLFHVECGHIKVPFGVFRQQAP